MQRRLFLANDPTCHAAWDVFLGDQDRAELKDTLARIVAREKERSTQSRQHLVDILQRLRDHVPGAALRTTFIVGFPGETDQDFAELCDFVRDQKFDHVGVFTYFPEEGTPAASLPGQVPDEVKEARQQELMAIQAEISRGRLESLVGTEVDVLVEGLAEESELLLRGRPPFQAPDVDGQVYIVNAPPGIRVGDIRRLRVTQAADYDLVGELVDVDTASTIA